MRVIYCLFPIMTNAIYQEQHKWLSLTRQVQNGIQVFLGEY